MIEESYNKQLKIIGKKIINESKKNTPDVVAIKVMTDNLHIIAELIRRKTVPKPVNY